ncbi:MAG TPA: inositol monophosphatase family protein [Xanthobacteraceae bacterium]|jgi:3'(2'), 5'-bisphosphate nucleotidase
MLKADGSGSQELLLDELCSVVSAAAAAILAARKQPLKTHTKPDQSPVTAADHASEGVILEALSRLLPGVPVVSEEAAAKAPLSKELPDSFVLVDPLDGTRELLAGRDEFTINLAVVNSGAPSLGIVAAPARGVLWRGVVGRGAERLALAAGAPASAASSRARIHTRAARRSGLVAAVSRSHLDSRTAALLGRLPVVRKLPCGSALKFGQLAEGKADVYPRLSTTCEWDVAAGHAVLAAAGGVVTTPEGGALSYGQWDKDFRVAGFIAWGDPAAAGPLGDRLR